MRTAPNGPESAGATAAPTTLWEDLDRPELNEKLIKENVKNRGFALPSAEPAVSAAIGGMT